MYGNLDRRWVILGFVARYDEVPETVAVPTRLGASRCNILDPVSEQAYRNTLIVHFRNSLALGSTVIVAGQRGSRCNSRRSVDFGSS